MQHIWQLIIPIISYECIFHITAATGRYQSYHNARYGYNVLIRLHIQNITSKAHKSPHWSPHFLLCIVFKWNLRADAGKIMRKKNDNCFSLYGSCLSTIYVCSPNASGSLQQIARVFIIEEVWLRFVRVNYDFDSLRRNFFECILIMFWFGKKTFHKNIFYDVSLIWFYTFAIIIGNLIHVYFFMMRFKTLYIGCDVWNKIINDCHGYQLYIK